MAKRQKLKRAVTLAGVASVEIYDKRTSDLLRNAQVAAVVVDDPGELVKVGRLVERVQPDGKLTVMRSLRDDPLGRMKSHGKLDEAKYEAGRHWQRCYEVTEIGGARAIDPSKEAVDGGRFQDNRDSNRYAKAFNDLCRAADPKKGGLGMLEGLVVKDVLANRMFLNRVGVARGFSAEVATRIFKEALEKLAILYGYAMPKPKMYG